MPPSFDIRVSELNTFLDRLRVRITDEGHGLRLDTATDRHSAHSQAGFERTFEVELAGTETRITVVARVLRDLTVICYIDDFPFSQFSGCVESPETYEVFTTIIASIRQTLEIKNRRR
jgi:hypothetical protein